MINVVKPFLPPLEEYSELLREVWDAGIITNQGPKVEQLEANLKEYLGVPNLLFLGNGTIALQIAIKALGLSGEVITTPFSYVATTASIVWENCRPVFVDIDPNDLNIDGSKIEQAITPKTTAILATHVFGNPCDVECIQGIAAKHGLKVIYDAAHCFATKYNGVSIFNFGDVSTTSFHATKVYHTGEGGAVIAVSNDLIHRMALMRNFGHWGPGNFESVGINGKNSELHAALGLINLKYINVILADRARLIQYYRDSLGGFNYKTIAIRKGTEYNNAYFPIIFESENQLLMTVRNLNENDIFPRRYFYPSLNKLMYVNSDPKPISESISKRILCLPLYYGLSNSEVDMIVKIILSV